MGQHMFGESDQNNGIKVTRTGGIADSYFSFFAAAFEPAIDCSARLRFTFNQGTEVASMTTGGVFTATGFIGPLTGNASTATAIATARTINGVSFNGSANILVPGNNVTATATLDFGSIAAGASEDLTITVAGAVVGYSVSHGLPAAPAAGIAWCSFVSAANTVTIRATNITGSPVDPASATYRATVFIP